MADYKRVGLEAPLEQLSNGTGLRVGWDAPHRSSGRLGLTRHEQQQALAELESDVLASSSKASSASRQRTIGKILAEWGLPLWPPHHRQAEGFGGHAEVA